jgi:perosamine synthetase
VRQELLPYGRQTVDESDVAAVVATLRSDWLTTGPKVQEFEAALSKSTGAAHAVAVSNGTAALHTMLAALDLRPGDEVIVPAMTFAATANAALYVGAKPVFADVDPDTLLISCASVSEKISVRTKAIVAVDFAGQAMDYTALSRIAASRGIHVLADACHALGGAEGGRPVGSLAEMSTFSFHPVKHVAAGEGGAVTCEDEALAARMRSFRNHGITTEHGRRAATGTWFYQMESLGLNYRLSDINCALALSQLGKLKHNVERRQEIARRYDAAFSELRGIQPLATRPGVSHAYHLYVIQVDPAVFRAGRAEFFAALRAENIGVNVHYIPVPWHPHYQRLGYRKGGWPVAEAAYERIITLPLWPGMTDRDADDVIDAVAKVAAAYRR